MCQLVWFGHEPAAGRRRRYPVERVGGCDQQSDPRPAATGLVRQHHTVHVSRYLHVGEEGMDIAPARVKVRQRGGGILRLKDGETSVHEVGHRDYSRQTFVLNNEDNKSAGWVWIIAHTILSRGRSYRLRRPDIVTSCLDALNRMAAAKMTAPSQHSAHGAWNRNSGPALNFE